MPKNQLLRVNIVGETTMENRFNDFPARKWDYLKQNAGKIRTVQLRARPIGIPARFHRQEKLRSRNISA